MLRIVNPAAALPLGKDWLSEVLLNLNALRLGLRRQPSVEQLPDRLRADVGLLPRPGRQSDLRDLRR